jgi:hypothetical protein
MRDLNTLNRYRVTDPKHLPPHADGWPGDGTCGAFIIPSPIDGRILRIIASNGEGWDHVSVSLEKRVPNWREMSVIHRMFFRDDEVAMQLHVPLTDHINAHPNVLHLWRSHDQPIPLPPRNFV